MNGSVTYEGSTLLSGAINVNAVGNIEALNVQVTENGTRTIEASSGVDGYSPITIETNVPIPEPELDSIEITQNGTYTPPSGTDGYNEINVNVPQEQPNIQSLTTTISSNGVTTLHASDVGADGFDPVTIRTEVPEPVLTSKTINSNGTYTPPSGVDGYDVVNVDVPLPENAYLLKEVANLPQPIATFTDGTSNPLKSLTVSIEPVQAGSGDPSPTNVRPISGWTEEVITVTDDTTTPTVEQTYTIPFTDGQGQSVEVFGGSVDVVNGTSGNKKIYDIVVFDGSEDENITLYNANTGGFWLGNIDSMKDYLLVSQNPPFVSDYLKTVSQSSAWISGIISEDKATKRIVACLSNFGTSVAECRQYLSQHPLTIRYELATPTTFYTQPTSIKSLDGDNNVSASTGQIEALEYFTS